MILISVNLNLEKEKKSQTSSCFGSVSYRDSKGASIPEGENLFTEGNRLFLSSSSVVKGLLSPRV